jgi:hypothetical protein
LTPSSIASFSRRASAVVCRIGPGPVARSHDHRPSTARIPTVSTASATAETSNKVPASQNVVVPLRIISTQARRAETCSSSGVIAE